MSSCPHHPFGNMCTERKVFDTRLLVFINPPKHRSGETQEDDSHNVTSSPSLCTRAQNSRLGCPSVRKRKTDDARSTDTNQASSPWKKQTLFSTQEGALPKDVYMDKKSLAGDAWYCGNSGDSMESDLMQQSIHTYLDLTFLHTDPKTIYEPTNTQNSHETNNPHNRHATNDTQNSHATNNPQNSHASNNPQTTGKLNNSQASLTDKQINLRQDSPQLEQNNTDSMNLDKAKETLLECSSVSSHPSPSLLSENFQVESNENDYTCIDVLSAQSEFDVFQTYSQKLFAKYGLLASAPSVESIHDSNEESCTEKTGAMFHGDDNMVQESCYQEENMVSQKESIHDSEEETSPEKTGAIFIVEESCYQEENFESQKNLSMTVKKKLLQKRLGQCS